MRRVDTFMGTLAVGLGLGWAVYAAGLLVTGTFHAPTLPLVFCLFGGAVTAFGWLASREC